MTIVFDTDHDHPMESVQYGHPERAMPFCVKRYRVRTDDGLIVHTCDDNHQTRNVIRFAEPVSARAITIQVLETWGAPAAVFEVQVERA